MTSMLVSKEMQKDPLVCMKAVFLCILFYDSVTGGVTALLVFTGWSNSDALKGKEVTGCKL